MVAQLFNWRTALLLAAVAIVTGTFFYSNRLAAKIAGEERLKIEHWVEAVKDISNSDNIETNLAGKILIENSQDIPMIAVTEKDSILDFYNLDSVKIKKDKAYLGNKLKEFAALHDPILWNNPLDSLQTNRVFYGDSLLLKQVKYFPLIQLFIVTLFIIVTLIAISTRNKSTQNQVWAGMAKETAHQLGTPISSLQGWVEMLKDNAATEKIATEMMKDVSRLQLVSDRFGKIGSKPHLERTNVLLQIENMMTYIKRRASERVAFSLQNLSNADELFVNINAPLFDWVIENLLKNALDAMEGKGSISIVVKEEASQIKIDVTDTGKGILKKDIPKIFKPGFTTKKRGWGLGLSLSKRIIDQYHQGSLLVKHSEIGKGTTFRIILKK